MLLLKQAMPWWLPKQEDTELDDQVRLMSGPEGSIRVVQLQPGQLSLRLWEPLCENNPNPAGPPLLLLPPEFDWLDPENGPRELAELMYIGLRVRAPVLAHPSHIFQFFLHF
jgi:hypothetical protein